MNVDEEVKTFFFFLLDFFFNVIFKKAKDEIDLLSDDLKQMEAMLPSLES